MEEAEQVEDACSSVGALCSHPQGSSGQGGDHHRRQGPGEEGDEARRQDTEMVTSVTT